MSAPQIAIEPPQAVTPVVIEPVTIESKEVIITNPFRANPIFSRALDLIDSFQEKRAALGLSNPGTLDGIAREVERDVLLNNYAFSGLRAEITKMFSASPLFQVSHALAMGSQGQPPYMFNALYGSPQTFCQASVYNDLRLQGRFNWRWTPSFVTKAQVDLPRGGDQAMLQMEGDYIGADFTTNLKAINPSFFEGGLTGIVTGDYLQAVTPRLSLGLNAVWQRAAMNSGPEVALSYAARYRADDWAASVRLSGGGSAQVSYWKRIADKVEGGVDLNLALQPEMSPLGPTGNLKKEGLATFGAKYDFRASTFRAQVDSHGRLGALLEKRVAPAVQVTFAGEIDHYKNNAKLGLAVQIENQPEELLEQAELQGGMGGGTPPPF